MTATPNDTDAAVYVFDRFRLETARRLLRTDAGERIPVVSKAFDTLLFFVRNPGRVISKDELMSSIWPYTVVEENNLNKNVSILRRALNEGRRDHRFIVTVPGQGYKFVADVEVCEDIQVVSTDPQDDKKPERNYKTLFAVAAIGAFLILGTAAFLWSGGAKSRPAYVTAAIAVLPFRPLVAEHRDEALELGMAEALISRLSDNRSLIVRPLSSVRGFNALDQDAIDAGHTLSVDFVVDGSIQRWGDMIRVTVRLVSVSDGTVLWSEAFDERFTDIFVVQNTISNRATAALSPRIINGGEILARDHDTKNPDAYAFYLRGRFYALKITEADVRKAIGFYDSAIKTDPNYALAYAGMADAYRTLASAGYASGNEVCPKAKELAERALSIDDSLAEAHIVLGWIHLLYTWDWLAAEKELLTAIDLNPNGSDAHRAYAHFLSNVGRHEEASREGRIARELAPLTLITAANEGQFLFYAGRDEEALDRGARTLELDPNFWVIHNVIGRIYLRQKRYPEAFAELEKAIELSHESPEPVAQLGYGYAVSGDGENALKILDRLQSLSKERYVPDYSFALVLNGLGETEKSLDHLERSCDAREIQLSFLQVDTRWDNLRNEKRFVNLITRMGIAPK